MPSIPSSAAVESIKSGRPEPQAIREGAVDATKGRRSLTENMDDPSRRRTDNRVLFAILIGAALLRLLYIDQPFVDLISWREADDAIIADSFFRGHLNIFLPEISWNGPGPSYVGYEFQLTTYLVALLYHLFGQGDWIGRGISVVFGIWGIFAFHNLVRRTFNEKRDRALVSSVVFAVMPGGILVDRSFLPDPVMVSLVVTSFWMLLAYLQDRWMTYLVLAVLTGTAGMLTKISGLVAALPMLYAIFGLLPASHRMRMTYFASLTVASVLMLAPVIGYYVWAIHVSHVYAPHLVAARDNWIWDASFDNWLEASYFWPKLSRAAAWLWGAPLLVSALVGLLFPPAQNGKGSLRWLFHYWLLAGIVFYAFGARELADNPWNFHIIDPALAGLAAQGLLVTSAALARFGLPMIGRGVIVLIIVSILGFEVKNLGWVYYPYARETRALGIALARISEPSDLVVTVGNDIGDPGAIYYSRRHGWVFPPLTPICLGRKGLRTSQRRFDHSTGFGPRGPDGSES
jgi:4-amino-4-deoxy-L-arabinose transferase-like glycosyltransferase